MCPQSESSLKEVPISRIIQQESLFVEEPDLGGYYGLAVRLDKILLEKDTPYQNLVVAEAGPLGRMLLLDGNIQVSEWDESGYHEMLVHVPLLTHPHPKRVLIIGGGDGGTLREVLKHPVVAQVDLCEIDEEVIEASRRYLPNLACGFDDPRVRIHIADGKEFLKHHAHSWDVVLVDGSDPVGPAEGLFAQSFYTSLRDALLPGGIAVTQCESAFLYESLIRRVFEGLSKLFPILGYYHTLVPTYTSGMIGFAFCSLERNPLEISIDSFRLKALSDLDYYSSTLHKAAFALPRRFLHLFPQESAHDRPVLLNHMI